MNNNSPLRNYGDNLLRAIYSIDQKNIDILIEKFLMKINGDGEVHLLGNGGSAANAHHIVGDFSKTFAILNKNLRMNCLSDNGCYITAVSNDIDYSSVYELLINTRIQKNDLIIFLSGSGNSMNLVKAARKAMNYGINTVSITGYSGGALKNIVDLSIHINVEDMEMAEDSQLILFHYIKQILINKLSNEEISMPKEQKRNCDDLIA
ncbi:SIS domain-containing protein [Prochlorococcus sp. MIT 0604]|uniref:SIS domain-containing protein n=1 Tax=Prochlorococcus sp. MIT 0604 TaxID=1501268 RepID=UPI0004F800CD|nr:SIS domain-containing protein [Prochlorococcus sp. MIT 0604]AIQ95468.1 phosphoheptose isomerase [Prochlorococcus sp. MIT 0604]